MGLAPEKSNISNIDFKKLKESILNVLNTFAAIPSRAQSLEYFSVNDLAKIVRNTRIQQKLNQKELAALAQISIGTMIAIENRKETTGFDTVQRVLKALGLNLWIK